MCERVSKLAAGTAEAYECSCDTEITHMVPAVVNGAEMYEVALNAAELCASDFGEAAETEAEREAETAEAPGSGARAADAGSKMNKDECGRIRIRDSAPSLASEDFAVFGEVIPSFFYWVGSGTPGKENAPWHDPAFRADDDYTKIAVPLLCAAAMA